MLRGQKMGISGNGNATGEQLGPHGRMVRHGGDGSRVGQALIAAAGAAIERRLVGIVLRRTAMGAENHHPRKIRRESHQAESGFHEVRLLGDGESRLGNAVETLRDPARADPLVFAQVAVERLLVLRREREQGGHFASGRVCLA